MMGSKRHTEQRGVSLSSSDSPVDSRELVSLIHHVELNKSGWLGRATERLVIAALWFVEPASSTDVIAFLKDGFDNRLSNETVKTILGNAEQAGKVVVLANEKFKVSESTSLQLGDEYKATQATELVVKNEFIREATDMGLEVDPDLLWSDFEILFMDPLARILGASLYQLFTSSDTVSSSLEPYSEVMKPISTKYGAEVEDLIIKFLDPSNTDIRTFVLAHLNTCYLREAIALDPSVISKLDESRGRPEQARIFLDTNFLFSFLGLHDNPGNELALDLLNLVASVQSSIKVTLYVLPDTLQEARRVLASAASQLSGVRGTRNLAEAASLMRSQGLAVAFLKAASENVGLTATEYFGTYEDNLLTLLRDKGVQLFNEDTSELHVDADVIDDLHDISDRQKRFRGYPKGYETNLHDMVLWHFVNRHRPLSIDSPLDAGSWICTLDYGLIAFDRRKQQGFSNLPVCLRPSALIQLMQFWLPRSESLDTALVGSMRQPILMLKFDPDTEHTTIKILKTMSRLRGVESISVASSYSVLTNEALRARVRPSTTESEMLQLVESAIAEEVVQLQLRVSELETSSAEPTTNAMEEQLRRAQAETQQMGELASSARSESQTLRAMLAEMEDRLVEISDSANSDRSALQDERDELRERLKSLEATSSTLAKSREAWMLTIGILGALVVAVGLAVGFSILMVHLWGIPSVSWALGSLAAIAGFLILTDILLGHIARFHEKSVHSWIRRLRTWLLAGLGALATGVLADWLYQVISNHSTHVH